MKKTFTKEYILENKGCYDTEQVLNLKCIDNKTITIKQLFNELPIKDFTWFLVKKCVLTLTEKRLFALHCAKQVLPIYEKKYPNDLRVRECVEATELYLNDKISKEDLREKISAAYDAAAYAAADAAYAAAYDADDAAYAAAGFAAAYKKTIWEFVSNLK